MSTNNEMELQSVLDDISIVMAGKKRFQQFRMLTDSERAVYDESYNRLIESGNSLLEVRASLKDFIEAQKVLDRAKLRMDIATGFATAEPVEQKEEQ